jgi:hypothetical protein
MKETTQKAKNELGEKKKTAKWRTNDIMKKLCRKERK